MRSPWIDLLFLHGHATPTQLNWRPDKPVRDASSRQIEVDVTQLPLKDYVAQEDACRA
ncbi:hypothetical protein [Dyella sp.]|jgi:hypothetical protein|uniref:hypothetical protein n=1 Tax=Dyella sp. TaxID=1869338 RepID=UPI002BCCD9E9|nr:hypothetical protein [Dyella sp.]HTC26219.1 hypothetical protein [Dyella sp.]